MAKLFEFANLKNRPARNGFDVSQHRFFTAKAGELLPCYVHEVIPGDKVKIDLKSFTRTRPVQTAAFTRLKEQVEFYFVPFRLLWKNWPNFAQSLMNVNNNSQTYIVTGLRSSNPVMVPPQFFSGDAQELLTAMKKSFAERTTSGSNYPYSIDEHGQPIFATAEKLLNYLGYGRLTSSEASSVSGFDAQYPEDLPDVNNPTSSSASRQLRAMSFSAFPLLAYQKIYQDHYRVNDWEQYIPNSCNVDYLSGDINDSGQYLLNLISYIKNDGFLSGIPWLFRLRYRNYRKDLFMGLRPTNNAADVTIPLNLEQFDGNVSSQSLTVQFRDTTASGGTAGAGMKLYNPQSATTQKETRYLAQVSRNGLPASSSLYLWDELSRFTNPSVIGTTIYDLRRAEALVKYMDINQASKHTYSDFIYRHFGYKTPDGRAQLAEFLGSFSGDIMINEVVNQNLVNEDAILKGQGISSMSGKDINFTASEAGIVMGIYSIIPQLDYASTGVDFLNVKTDASQFFVPEFDRLGLETMSEVHLTNNPSNANVTNQLLGYAPRYLSYKTCKDSIYGDFLASRKDWVAPLTAQYLREWTNGNAAVVDGLPKLTWNFMKVNPHILDSIFGVAVNGSVTTDQFDVAVNVDCMKVSSMDVDGMPY